MGGARSKDFAYSMNIGDGGGSLHTVTVVQPLHWSRNISLHLPTAVRTLSFSPTTSPLLLLISSSVLVQHACSRLRRTSSDRLDPISCDTFHTINYRNIPCIRTAMFLITTNFIQYIFFTDT